MTTNYAASEPVKHRAFAAGQSGFTLMESLTTLLIVSTMAVIGMPTLQDGIERNQKSSAVNNTFAMLSATRMEAAARGTTVALCGSSNQTSCDTESWEKGWLMFVDDGAGAGTPDDGNIGGTEELLQVGQAAPGQLSVRSQNFADAGAISFGPDGMASERGTLVVCDEWGSNYAKAVVLSVSGQARMAIDSNADGVVESDTAAAVACP